MIRARAAVAEGPEVWSAESIFQARAAAEGDDFWPAYKRRKLRPWQPRHKPEAPMSAEEAWAAADAAGLALIRRTSSVTGFANVTQPIADAPSGRPFQARRADKTSLGYFSTAEQAALAYSRHLGPEVSMATVRALYDGEYPRTAEHARDILQQRAGRLAARRGEPSI